MMGSDHLGPEMFKHNVAHLGVTVKTETLMTTHVTNSGKISYKEFSRLDRKYVRQKLRRWHKVKSKFLMILNAIFNPSK